MKRLYPAPKHAVQAPRTIPVQASIAKLGGSWRVLVELEDGYTMVLAASSAADLASEWARQYGDDDAAVCELYRLAAMATAGGVAS